jgi:hypothetical protein
MKIKAHAKSSVHMAEALKSQLLCDMIQSSGGFLLDS